MSFEGQQLGRDDYGTRRRETKGQQSPLKFLFERLKPKIILIEEYEYIPNPNAKKKNKKESQVRQIEDLITYFHQFSNSHFPPTPSIFSSSL